MRNVSGNKLLGTAFSLEMESSTHGIYLRVTVPLTNLHRDLDFVGTFFLWPIALRFGRWWSRRGSSLSAREVISRSGVSSLASNFNYFVSF